MSASMCYPDSKTLRIFCCSLFWGVHRYQNRRKIALFKALGFWDFMQFCKEQAYSFPCKIGFSSGNDVDDAVPFVLERQSIKSRSIRFMVSLYVQPIFFEVISDLQYELVTYRVNQRRLDSILQSEQEFFHPV